MSHVYLLILYLKSTLGLEVWLKQQHTGVQIPEFKPQYHQKLN
jgi:hypothetical protein